MKSRKHLFLIAFAIFIFAFNVQSEKKSGKTRILLIGDSTTEGGKPIFEETIESLLTGEEGLPEVDVINVGMGGETAFSLLNSGRYEKAIASIDSIDLIFLRYGINDFFHRQPVDENFPADMKAVINRLHNDFEEAQIILMTIIPFLNEEGSKQINDMIRVLAKDENLLLFDIYPAYKVGLQMFGLNSMNVRYFPLSKIPANLHKIVEPFTAFSNWKKEDYVRVKTTELDPLLGHLPNWYSDKHPNTMAYRLMANETAKYLIPILKDNN